jgi:serine/threonine protein kinase/tetratricopeptide (TPR) repeat protein
MNERSIFIAALEKDDPAERAAYLDQACGDGALRQRIERWLAAHAAAGGILDRPVGPEPPTVAFQPILEQAGAVIGGYKLIEPIGEGGMGKVWMAQQTEPVKRLVALKLIKAGMDSKQVIARFEAERQALALMDHANIARVLDAGTTGAGRPYFVMDLVKGVPITRYCDEHRLTPRQRLELFIPVCQAVQHAHQKGIIHRDLKPSNVIIALYDGKPVPKVIDFGVAKAAGQSLTDKTLVTGFGNIIGTLEYMSPEQAEINQLDIDTRSDIYSLGVLLYELLTGSPPFTKKELEKAGMLEMLRVIREKEPSKPSTKLSTAEGLPTLAANRGTEPAKLTKLVRGELDWLVMKALEKDRARRYETANGLAMDVERYLCDEPVLACPPSAGYRLRKFARRNRVVLATAAVVAAALVVGTALACWQAVRATRAEAAEKQAKESALKREGETKAVLEFVENKVIAAARPKGQEGGQGYDVKLADAIQAALPFVEKGFSGQPLIEARLRMTMGISFWYLGHDQTALEQFEAARQLYTRHLGPDHHDTLWSINNLANSYGGVGRIQEALQLREETLRLRKAKLGPDHPETLTSMNNLANSYADAGRFQEALQLREETLRLRKAILGPDHPDTLMSMDNLANSYDDAGRIQEALKLHEETLQLRNAKLGPDHPATLGSMDNVASSYFAVGRLQDALKLQEETLRLRNAKLGPDHPATLASMHSLAVSYGEVGRIQEALKLEEETLQLKKTKLGPDHPDTLSSMNCLGFYYSRVGRYQEALKLEEETLQLSKGKLGPDHPATLGSMASLANCYDAVGRIQEAIKLREETLQLKKAKLGPDHPSTLATMTNLAVSYYNAGRHQEALKLIEETLALQKAKLGADHPRTLVSMNNLADLLANAPDTKLRDPKRAVELATEIVKLSPKEGTFWNTLGMAQYRAGNWKAAITALEKSMDLSKGGNSNDWFFLAMTRWQLGDKKDARKWYDQAVEWQEKNQPKNVELTRFRAEAAELLGIKGPSPSRTPGHAADKGP